MVTWILDAWVCLRGPVARRWLNWVVVAAGCFVTATFLILYFRRSPEAVHAYFSVVETWQRVTFTFIICLLITFLLFHLATPRIRHLRWHVFKVHPPLWSAGLIAVVVVCMVDLVYELGPTGFQTRWWEWTLHFGGAVLVVSLYRHFSSPPSSHVVPPLAIARGSTTITELVHDSACLEHWLKSEKPADQDLIGNHRVARRLASHLLSHGGSCGLVGPFGSGKSSVVQWLRTEVVALHVEGQPVIWFCEVSCWGFEDSAAAVQSILGKAVSIVGQHADSFTLRSLPELYRKTFSAGGDWLRTVSDILLGSADPMEQFRHLAEILQSIKVRLVFVVEDLDRTITSRFDRQEVLALLQRLRMSDRFSFILAAGYTHSRDIDFAKLCDHIEVLPDIDPESVIELIRAVRSRLLLTLPLMGVIANSDPWQLRGTTFETRYNRLTLPLAAAQLLRTPRALKHALRRTHEVWRNLSGEVDVDHLLAVNVLRYGAPEAFNFLLRHRQGLADDPRKWLTGQDQVQHLQSRYRGEWDKTIVNADWNQRAAIQVLGFLLPVAGKYLGNDYVKEATRLQGIGFEQYWLRIVNEELDRSEVRDFTVVSDIQSWLELQDPQAPLVRGLLSSSKYVAVWEHFAHSILGQEPSVALTLADQVLTGYRTAQGTRLPRTSPSPFYGDVPFPDRAFTALSQFVKRYTIPAADIESWLEQQIRAAVPLSLTLVNDLYAEWGSLRHQQITPRGRDAIRKMIHDECRNHLVVAEDLIRVCHPSVHFDFYQLVFPPDENSSVCHGLEHWSWLGPLLLDALIRNRSLFAQKVATLISVVDPDNQFRARRYVASSELLFGFFADKATEVTRQLAAERDVSEGTVQLFLDQVVRSSEQFLRS